MGTSSRIEAANSDLELRPHRPEKELRCDLFERSSIRQRTAEGGLVTGCLVKGDEPKEVWLAEKDGTIYGLESSKIELNAYLGHKVIVRGYVPPEGKEEAGEEAQKQNKTGKRENAELSCAHAEDD